MKERITFNRTIVELKPVLTGQRWAVIHAFNRTIVELKHIDLLLLFGIRFNF